MVSKFLPLRMMTHASLCCADISGFDSFGRFTKLGAERSVEYIRVRRQELNSELTSQPFSAFTAYPKRESHRVLGSRSY